MENREFELQQCRAEVAELSRRVDALRLRIDALEGKPAAVLPKPVQTPAVQTKEKPNRQNLESAVGRNLFAVLASVLVLIGVGVFISTIYEQIPEIVKIAAIYIFGFGLLGAGLAIYRKNDNKFWLGVASCGLAELLVSIITSHSYFGVLPLLPTFALVLVWILASFWLTKFHPTVFKAIGFVGFLISMALGVDLVAWNELGIFLTLLGAYVVLSVFFMITNRSYVNLNTAMAICSVAGLLMFWTLKNRLPEGMTWIQATIVLSIMTVFHLTYVWKSRMNKNAYPMFAALSLGVAAVLLLGVYRPAVIIPLLGGISLLLWTVQYYWGCDRQMRFVYTGLVGVCLFFAAEVQLYGSLNMWWYMALAAGAYGLYWLTKKRDIAWLGWFCFLILMRCSGPQNRVTWVLFLTAGMIFFLSDSSWLRRDRALQTAWYVLVFALCHDLLRDLRAPIVADLLYEQRRPIYEISDAVFYTILAAMNVWYLHRTLADQEKLLKINLPSLVVMGLQVYVLTECMTSIGSNLWYVSALGIMGSMMILSYSLWYTFKTKGVSRKLMVWQFVKFTLYFWAVLAILDSPNILIHISLLLVAILAVAVGFKLGHKAVRVYGLALSLLDVVSLVLFNIDYGNSLQLAGGIVLCGALCFVISFIYSRLSKVF